MDGGSDLARTEFSTKPDAANLVPPTGPIAGSYGFTYLNLDNIGNTGLQHIGLNPTDNVG